MRKYWQRQSCHVIAEIIYPAHDTCLLGPSNQKISKTLTLSLRLFRICSSLLPIAVAALLCSLHTKASSLFLSYSATPLLSPLCSLHGFASLLLSLHSSLFVTLIHVLGLASSPTPSCTLLRSVFLFTLDYAVAFVITSQSPLATPICHLHMMNSS